MAELPAVAVCTDEAGARIVSAAGVAVVVVGSDGAALGRLAAELRSGGRGRVAVLVGDASHEADLGAALAMAQEQFGAAVGRDANRDTVVVSSAAEAGTLLAAGAGRGRDRDSGIVG